MGILAVVVLVVYLMTRDGKRYRQRIQQRLSTSLPKRTGRVDDRDQTGSGN